MGGILPHYPACTSTPDEDKLMKHPTFFEKIETIKLQDDLSNFLGTFEDGYVEFTYLDIVKSAGHSCPTVLGAYLMASEGLKALYKNEIAKRGEIMVEFAQNENEGVAGVIANVITNITGATVNLGFKGIAGDYDRRNLMQFEAPIKSNVKFTRKDCNDSVDVFYDPSSIPGDPKISMLMQLILQENATSAQQKEFGILWQQRVEAISNRIGEVIKVD
jgi:hypothetical protein